MQTVMTTYFSQYPFSSCHPNTLIVFFFSDPIVSFRDFLYFFLFIRKEGSENCNRRTRPSKNILFAKICSAAFFVLLFFFPSVSIEYQIFPLFSEIRCLSSNVPAKCFKIFYCLYVVNVKLYEMKKGKLCLGFVAN